MNIIEVDFQSVVIGYVVGIALMWSIHTVLFEETIDEEKPKENNTTDNNETNTEGSSTENTNNFG